MTLKEKFEEVNILDYRFKERDLDSKTFYVDAKKCEKIAEDFTIGFMKWFYENAYLIEWLSNDHKREQLLKAYKNTL